MKSLPMLRTNALDMPKTISSCDATTSSERSTLVTVRKVEARDGGKTWYELRPQKVTVSESSRILWDFLTQTDQTMA